MHRRLIAALQLVVGGCFAMLLCACQDTTAQRVYPNALSNSRSIELADAISMFIPDAGHGIGWAWLSNSSDITWLDNGYVELPDETIRRGVMRINVLGVRSTVLRQATEELGWTVTMSTKSLAKFGPREISLWPGADDPAPCFGNLFEGCDFDPLPSLKRKGINATLVCKSGMSAGNFTAIYSLTAKGKSQVLFSISRGEGSGGASTNISILLDHDKKRACTFE